MRDDNINISDVIEVIETYLDFGQSTMFNGGSAITHSVGLPTMTPMPTVTTSKPKVKIIEQPASKALRFRYECEGRSAGSIPGISSTPENKTFPAIQIIGYQGRAVVVVSCVTKDQPHRPHPHNLVGREGCKKGVCTLEVSPETMSVTFSNLGIQCVKKKDIEAALKVREEIRVDPFRTGFAHRNQPTSIDLNAVRLCFQVFLEGEQRGKFTVPLTPVVSEPIYDKKAMCDLIIVKLSDCVSTVDGGRKDIILLCEKVAKEDIKIRFFEEHNGQTVWEAEGEFQPSQVHKQTAIWFRAPRYKTLEVTEPVKVSIQLLRPSDGATSEPLPFEYLPLDSEPGMLKRKRQKYENDPKSHILLQLQEQEQNRLLQQQQFALNIPIDAVKSEPREVTSPYAYGGLSPMYTPNSALSPQQQYRVPFGRLSATPPPADLNLTYKLDLTSGPSVNVTVLPPISSNNTIMLSQHWNILNNDVKINADDMEVGATGTMNIETHSGLSSLLDLDSQQMELRQLNSGELATLNLFDTHTLSENLSANLSLSDINMPLQDKNNMTDSFTQLANSTIDSICQLNQMYKPNK